MSSIFLKFFVFQLLLCVVVSGCAPPGPETPQTVQVGTVADFKVSGRHYRGEVTELKDGYVLWVFSRNQTPVFKLKTYRGLLSVYSEEEGFKSWSKFDPKTLDQLFPIETGKEVSLEGRHYTKNAQEGYPFFVTITVREKSQIMLKDKPYNVFILDYSITEDHPEGTKIFTQTVWYSETLEASLRNDYQWDDGTFSMRVLSLEMPEGKTKDDNKPEDLGTVRL